jgi:glutaredoxin
MVKIYTSNWCGYCNAAKNLLNKLDIQFEEINIEEINMSRQDLLNLTGEYTVPQISINSSFIGGYQELQILYQNNKLEKIINGK